MQIESRILIIKKKIHFSYHFISELNEDLLILCVLVCLMHLMVTLYCTDHCAVSSLSSVY